MKNIIPRLRQTAVALGLSVAALSSQAGAPPGSASETLVSSTARAMSACIEGGSADKAMGNPEFCGEGVDPVTIAASGVGLLGLAGVVGTLVRRRKDVESIDISKCPPLMQESLRKLDVFIEAELPGIKVIKTRDKRNSSYTFGITQGGADDLTVEIDVDGKFVIYEIFDNEPNLYYNIDNGKRVTTHFPVTFGFDPAKQVLLSLKHKLEVQVNLFKFDEPPGISQHANDRDITPPGDVDAFDEAVVYAGYNRSHQAISHLREAISASNKYDEIILRLKIIDLLYRGGAETPDNPQPVIQLERGKIDKLMDGIEGGGDYPLYNTYISHLAEIHPLEKTPEGAFIWVDENDRDLYQKFSDIISSYEHVTFPLPGMEGGIEQLHTPSFTTEQYLEALAGLPDRTPIAVVDSLLRSVYTGLDIGTMDSSDVRSLQGLCEKYESIGELREICNAIQVKLTPGLQSVE